MERCKNHVVLCGTMLGDPVYSHSLYGEAFYSCTLSVPRLSGVEDRLPVTVSERLLCACPVQEGRIAVTGQLRSYNRQTEGANRLILTVFAQSLEPGAEPCNEILLTGYLCKPPVYRITPFSREISDLLLAVNRPYNKSDYIPCICWGRNARFAGTLCVGACISAVGRIQSRVYQKRFEDGTAVERTAYEVSVGTIEVLP